MTESHARAILFQVLSGMRYLSSSSEDNSRKAIIHYDLKQGNILFVGHGHAISKIVDSQDPAESMCWDILIPAARMLRHNKKCMNNVSFL